MDDLDGETVMIKEWGKITEVRNINHKMFFPEVKIYPGINQYTVIGEIKIGDSKTKYVIFGDDDIREYKAIRGDLDDVLQQENW